MTNQEIKTVGQTIAQETQIGGNTAARVGGVVEGIGVALDNKDAANGYYQATINGGSISVNAPNYLLGSGGNLRIKMPSAGTTASTLTIGNANAVQLWYNGAAVSAQNTWEADEIISVFYDGTRFMASNSQGGGGKAEKIKYDNSQSGLDATNVQEALDEIEETVSNIEDTIIGSIEDIDYSSWPKGAYIRDSGDTNTSTAYKHTPKPILVKAGQTLSVKSDGYNYYVFLKTNADMSSVEGITKVNSTSSGPYTYTPNEDTYVLVSLMTSGGEIKLNKEGVIDRIESLETEVYGAKSNVEYTNQAQGFINSDGYANTKTSNYSYTNLIDVSSYAKIEIMMFYASSSTLVIAAYKDGTESIDIASQVAVVSKSVAGNNNDVARSYKIPLGIRYIRLTYERTKSAAPIITGYAKTTISELVQQTTELDERVDVLEKDAITTVVLPVAEFPGMSYYHGKLTTVSNAMCKKYDVEGIETLLITASFNAASAGFYIAIFVDSNDTVIEQQHVIPAGSTEVVTNEPFSVPSGAKFAYINSRGDTSLPEVKAYSKIVSGIKTQSGGKYISILFIGNSLTQDAVSYVPLLLRELAPDLKFKFYIWYNGGYSLAQQLSKFNNDETCEIFSTCENGIGWGNLNNSVKMSLILSTFQFDIVCLQEYFNYNESANLEAFNGIIEYIENHYTHPFKVVTLFHQPKRDVAETVFSNTKIGNALLLKETVAEDMIPSGIAIYRALSTSLDSLGDKGHLSPDGTHAQEGLPCMMQAYVTAMWILKQVGIPMSVNNASSVVDDSNYASINVPGANLGTGVVVGTTEQVRLSQLVAIKAFKEGESFVNSNLTEYTT